MVYTYIHMLQLRDFYAPIKIHVKIKTNNKLLLLESLWECTFLSEPQRFVYVSSTFVILSHEQDLPWALLGNITATNTKASRPGFMALDRFCDEACIAVTTSFRVIWSCCRPFRRRWINASPISGAWSCTVARSERTAVHGISMNKTFPVFFSPFDVLMVYNREFCTNEKYPLI